MKTARLLFLFVAILLLVLITWLLFSPARKPFFLGPASQRVVTVMRRLWQEWFPPVSVCQLAVTGTPGTQVVLGYRVDGSSSSRVIRGVIPMSCQVRARRSIYVAVKNVGTTSAKLGFDVSGHGGSGSALPFPPFYGFSGQESWTANFQGGGGSGTLTLIDWPVTLPPGMAKRAAKQYDFQKNLLLLRLRDTEASLAQNPTNAGLLAGAGSYCLKLKNYSAAESFYQRFFASDCNDPTFLNIVAYEYANTGGTNVDAAYEIAMKARSLSVHNPFDLPSIDDTIAWIQVKRGYYSNAVSILSGITGQRRYDEIVDFHLGMADYMLGEEDTARKGFQKFLAHYGPTKPRPPEANQATKCLALLDLKGPRRKLETELKNRLAEVPDDPVALSRLAEQYDVQDGSKRTAPEDPLVLKALGVRAYRQGDHSRAIACLTASAVKRSADADVFFFLGIAQWSLSHPAEAAVSMRKALALGLKSAQAEQANKILGSVAQMR